MGDDQQSLTSLSLIQRATNADAQAWERLCRIYSPLVLEWVIKARVGREDSADVVQEVFWAISRGLEKFKSENRTQSFRGWLWGITRHKIADYFRKREAQPMAEGGSAYHQFLQELPDPISGDESDSISVSGQGGIIVRALELIKSQFEETTWQAFWKVAVDGLSPSDVSSQLGISLGAVYTAKSRVLSLLRRELQGLETII